MYEPLNVFLSFASDVENEIEIAERVIHKINQRVRSSLRLSLESTTWKELPPLSPEPPRRIQDEIDEKVQECNIFVLVLFRRYGSIEPGTGKSNLEREVEKALARLGSQRKIMFLTYFHELPENPDPGYQEQRVVEFRKSLRARGIWFREYKDLRDFEISLTHDLYDTLLKYRHSTQKHKALKRLWTFGETDRPTHPGVAIVYPPVDREFLRRERPDMFWQRRLVPHLVFEDHKCLQKIEKTLRLINFRNYRIFATVDAPAEINFMNRIWLCWPRNLRAAPELDRYLKRGAPVARFRFSAGEHREPCIHWRLSAGSASHIKIKSPLRKYLEVQRADRPGGKWTAEKGRIIAKDFAVLARFSDLRDPHVVHGMPLKDFFIGGIRGLGTWGAGWFIDRRYAEFKQYAEDADIQLLLEVTYKAGRIIEVRDVSNESDLYFRTEYSMRRVRKVIRDEGP